MSSAGVLSISAWEYRDLSPFPPLPEVERTEASTPVQPKIDELTEADVERKVQTALAEAREGWLTQVREEERRRDLSISIVVSNFAKQRSLYFKAVEGEVVQLALAIAKKILQREAELDPTLLVGLVRIALDRLGTERAARMRVAPTAADNWKRSLALGNLTETVHLIEDPTISADDCVVETECGCANFGFTAQLRDIEVIFSDLLARRREL